MNTDAIVAALLIAAMSLSGCFILDTVRPPVNIVIINHTDDDVGITLEIIQVDDDKVLFHQTYTVPGGTHVDDRVRIAPSGTILFRASNQTLVSEGIESLGTNNWWSIDIHRNNIESTVVHGD